MKQGFTLFVVGLGTLLVGCSITVVPAGHVGVVDLFGNVSPDVRGPGIGLVHPLARVRKLSVRTQEREEKSTVPSSEGLNINLDVSVLFNLDPAQAATVYKTLGTNYLEVFIVPQLRSHVRGATAEFEAKALYTSGREEVAQHILRDLAPELQRHGIQNVQILIRDVTLPGMVAGAIQQKLKAEQEAEQMRFVLQREHQEAERKRVEARGIADFQNIVTRGISEPLLRWKGIEATEALAKSPNAKVVVIGGTNGLPLILNSP